THRCPPTSRRHGLLYPISCHSLGFFPQPARARHRRSRRSHGLYWAYSVGDRRRASSCSAAVGVLRDLAALCTAQRRGVLHSAQFVGVILVALLMLGEPISPDATGWLPLAFVRGSC